MAASLMNQELFYRLQRQRQKIGESGSPLRAFEHPSRCSVDLDYEVRVKQRALRFQPNGERQPDDWSPGPQSRCGRLNSSGRLNLELWESSSRGASRAHSEEPTPCQAGIAVESRQVQSLFLSLPTPSRAFAGVAQIAPSPVASAPVDDELAPPGSSSPPEHGKLSSGSPPTPQALPFADDPGSACQAQEEGDEEDEHKQEDDCEDEVEVLDQHSVKDVTQSLDLSVAGYDEASEITDASLDDGVDEEGCAASCGGACSAGDGDCSLGGPQVLRPLQEWVDAADVHMGYMEPVPEAACFCMSTGEPLEEAGQDGGAYEARLVEELLARGLRASGHEPLEYDLLEYLGHLPEELVCKLKRSQEMHEELVQRLNLRLQTLQAKARSRNDVVEKGPPPRPRSATVEAQEEWRRELRSQMAGRVMAAQEARLRLSAEAREASSRAKLEQTRRAVNERVATLTRRAEREENECRGRVVAAKLERERVRRSLAVANQELEKSRQQVEEAEEAMRIVEIRAHDAEKARKPKLKEAEGLRAELKTLRAQATRNQCIQQRTRDLQKELDAVMRALGGRSVSALS